MPISIIAGVMKQIVATAKLNPIKAAEEVAGLTVAGYAATKLLRIGADEIASSLKIKIRT